MSEARPPMERINLRLVDDSRDVVHRAVAALAQGERVLFLGEKFSGLIGGLWLSKPFPSPRADNSSPWILLIRGTSDLADWVPDLPALGARLARRVWPSPLALVFPIKVGLSLFDRLSPSSQAVLKTDHGLGVQIPDHPFVREVIRLVPGPLAFQPLSLPKVETNPTNPRDLVEENPEAFLVIEDHREPLELKLNTMVRVDEDHWTMIREGAVSASILNRMSATIILFVCTGNTCRSPLAEALCKILLAKRLACEISELESRGYVVLSAGVAASNGMPAASNAIQVAEARGGSLRGHASRQVTGDLVDVADHVLAMTSDHLDVLVDREPEVANRARLLHPEGDDVPDPVGMDLEVYKRTANAIESYLNAWLDSIGL